MSENDISPNAIPPHEIFISYSRNDSVFADHLYNSLTTSHFTVWMDRTNIQGGDDWQKLMLLAVEQARVVILILSPEALTSEYVRQEYLHALATNKLLIPMCYRAGGTMPKELADLHIIDAQNILYIDKAILAALQPLRKLLRPETYVPPFDPVSRQPNHQIIIEPTNMPRPLLFVGRDKEAQRIMAALREGNPVGVCAVQGMGGIGKSALAAVAVDQLRAEQDTFPGGAAWISAEGLSGTDGLDALVNAIAFVLGLDDVATMPTPTIRQSLLMRHLAMRPRTLLAIDNLEPTFPAATLVQALSIPQHTSLILTARHQIAANLHTQITLEPLEQSDAITLLQQRLQQADMCRPTADDIPWLPLVAVALGGLPLALELTAAYVGNQKHHMQKILMDLQTHGLNATALADPQRGLRYSFQRSWHVLTNEQQTLFAGLVLFEGATILRAAAEALASATTPTPPAQIDGLVSLALVEALPNERLRLHPLLRDYAQEQLYALPAEQQSVLGKHMLMFWQDWAAEHWREIFIMDAEAEGLMGAVTYAHANEQHHALIALVKWLNYTWDIRGRRDELRKMINWGLESAIVTRDVLHQRWMQHSLAMLDGEQGRMEDARIGYQRALELAQQLGDISAVQAAIHGLAVADHRQGRVEEARLGFQQALELATQQENISDEQTEILCLALLEQEQGHLELAQTMYLRTLELARQSGDLDSEQTIVHNLSELYRQQGQMKKARTGYLYALDLSRHLGDIAAEHAEVHSLGLLDYEEGKLDEARANYTYALELALKLGDIFAERAEVHGLAIIDVAQRHKEEANAGFQYALKLARQIGDQANEAIELVCLGAFVGQDGQPEEGKQLIQQALSIYQQLGNLYEIGRAYMLWAYVDIASKDTTAAIAHYHKALSYLEQVDAAREIEEIKFVLEAMGG